LAQSAITFKRGTISQKTGFKQLLYRWGLVKESGGGVPSEVQIYGFGGIEGGVAQSREKESGIQLTDMKNYLKDRRARTIN